MVQSVTNGLYRFCEWVMRLAYLNLLWILFSFAGVIILGTMPATAAMFSVAHKWVNGNTDTPIFRTFWETYRTEFVKINILGWILCIIAVVFYIDFSIFDLSQGKISSMKLIFTSLLLVYGVIILFIFPVYIHYKISVWKTCKYALLIGFSRPLHTLGMAVGAFGLLYVNTLHVTIAVFFSGSVFCVVMTWFAVKAFTSIEHSYTKWQSV